MKTPYLRSYVRGNSAARSTVFWSAGVAILVVLIIFIRLALPGVFMSLTAPLIGSGTSLTGGVGNVFSGFTANTVLAMQNKSLAAQNAELKNENAVLQARTQDLTKLLGGTSSAGLDSNNELLAGVLSRPPESPYDTLTIAMGSSDGITGNATVFANGGIPIGSIKSVNAHSAQVSLYSTAGRSTDGWVGSDRTPVTLMGAGSGAFTATIPKTSAVVVGDSVYVPGPGALPIGTIIRIDGDPSSPISTLQIQPLTNLFSITWVDVARTQ